MLNEIVKEINISSVVRSGVILILGAPVVLGLGAAMQQAADTTRSASTPSLRDLEMDVVQGELTPACIKYIVAKSDSKLEREAKSELDDYFSGDVNHAEVCKWVFS